jgi:hypothetical protein
MSCSICLGLFLGKDKSVLEKANTPASILNVEQNKISNDKNEINSINSENRNSQQVEVKQNLEIDSDLRVLPYGVSRTSISSRCSLRILILKLRNIKSTCSESLEHCKRKCNRELTTDANYMYTPCNHLFHLECLKAWMEIKNTCPECRRILPIEQAQMNPPNREEAISI